MNLTINKEELSPVFHKHHIEGLPFGASFNHFLAPDTGDAHDHPFAFASTILSGWYIEEIFRLDKKYYNGYYRAERLRQKGERHIINETDIHRIVKVSHGGCITLMIPLSGHTRKSRFWKFEENGIWSRAWDEQDFTKYNP